MRNIVHFSMNILENGHLKSKEDVVLKHVKQSVLISGGSFE